MSANIIIFDSQYTDDQIKQINNAGKCLEEAIQILHQSKSHRGWQCKEVKNINDSLESINSSLKKINRGVTAASQALNRGREQFNILETRSQRASQKLLDNLREKYGFNASVRGKDEKTKLPVTEIPRKEDPFIVKAIKGTAKNIIQGLGTFIGASAGALGNGINKAAEGFITDVNDGVISPMVNIFKASYSLGKPPYDDTGKSLMDIATNSIKLIGLTVGVGGDLAEKGLILGNLNKFDDMTKFIGKIYGEGGNAFDAGALIGEVIKDPGQSEEAMNQFIGMIGDSLIPFGLDQTVIQGLNGITSGAQAGADFGSKISNVICSLIGL